MISSYTFDDDDDDDDSSMRSRTRWIDSKNTRWESSHCSWEDDSETGVFDSAKSLSRFETIEYGRGAAEGYGDQQAVVDCGQWAPRKPLRRESMETGFHRRTEACPCDYSRKSHPHDGNDSGRAPVDYLSLPSSPPRSTIQFQAIRPPRKPVRQVSYESGGVPLGGTISPRKANESSHSKRHLTLPE